jgi:LysM repeat protein
LFKTIMMINLYRFFALSLIVVGLASCKSASDPYAAGAADPYATNVPDAGGYNPYPGQSGYASTAAPSYAQPPSYQAPAPEPTPQYDPYAYSAPKKSPSATSSASKKKTTAPTSTKKKTSTASKRHTVKKGDTLYGIARSGGTTVAKLKSANGLTSDVIRPGQTLKIP